MSSVCVSQLAYRNVEVAKNSSLIDLYSKCWTELGMQNVLTAMTAVDPSRTSALQGMDKYFARMIFLSKYQLKIDIIH